MNLYCLRVKKGTAGKTFPFDRVYLAPNGEHACFKELFRYALVLPVDARLKDMLLHTVHIESGGAHPFDRDDTAAAPTSNEWKARLEEGDWVLAVPILAKYVKENMPRYLVAAGKYREPQVPSAGRRRRYTRSETVDPFPNLTYLQTPTAAIRPVCVACPRFILHQNGHCRLGEEICYTSLALGLTNHFKEGLDVPLPPENELLQAEEI